MDKKYYIYEWFNKDTGEVFYVGKGCKNRYSQTTGRNKFFLDYLNTHNCESRITVKDLTEKQAFDLEIETIKWYKENTNYRLTNQTDGGDGNSFPCGEKNPKFGKGKEIEGVNNPFYGKKHIPRVKQILSEKAKCRIGEKNPFYGKQHSEETKQILREKAKKRLEEKGNPMSGKKHSEESKQKMSEKRKGRVISEETRRKLSEKGKGRVVSEETRRKISESNKRRWANTPKNKPETKIETSLKEETPIINTVEKNQFEQGLSYIRDYRGEKNPNWGNGDKIRGEKNPMFNKQHSEETRRKMSERAKNRTFDKICLKCQKEFVAKAHNTKYCPECKPRRKK